MKRLVPIMLCLTLVLCFVGCGNAKRESVGEPVQTNTESSMKETVDTSEEGIVKTDEHVEETTVKQASTKAESSEGEDVASMKLYINETEIPVIWEENRSVREIMEEAAKGDIIVEMSMYSDNEQVGSLGRSYISNNKQTTTHNGDIVLYNSSNIVVFYGSNSWSYTRLGKMNLSESEVTAMLSNGDVQLKITE